MNRMEQLFDELDHDRSGHISLSELREKIVDAKVIAFLQALKMDVRQVGKLFNLLDTDKSGTIDKQEFMVGCTNLRGEAMQLDVAILQGETRSLKELVMRLADHLDDRLELLLPIPRLNDDAPAGTRDTMSSTFSMYGDTRTEHVPKDNDVPSTPGRTAAA
ncbi:unnamed protein product [Prorocentrum cordatum]|uniref:EF-hand domain-containing protein n=1 Tax=Prorocentrum cordatum TaxID=2364126 RepID=A0ABN9W8T4_9DINO|nr:unnamed protein product [Polarella glacialis]